MKKEVIIYNDLPNYIFEYHYFKNELVGRFLYTKEDVRRITFNELSQEEQTTVFALEMEPQKRNPLSTDATAYLAETLASRKDRVSEPFTNKQKLGAKFDLLNIEHVFGEWQYAIFDKEEYEKEKKNKQAIKRVYILRLDAFGKGLIKPNWNEEEFTYQVDYLNNTITEKNQLFFISINEDMFFYAYKPDDRIFFYHAADDQTLDCLILENGEIINFQNLPMLKARATQKDVVKYAKLIDSNFLFEEAK